MPATVSTAAKKKMVRVERASQNDFFVSDRQLEWRSTSVLVASLVSCGLGVVIVGGADLHLRAFVQSIRA